jgi:hypothetical protein
LYNSNIKLNRLMILVVGSVFFTFGGYGRITFGADQSIVPNDETGKRLTDEFWNEIDRLGIMPAMNGQRGGKIILEVIEQLV